MALDVYQLVKNDIEQLEKTDTIRHGKPLEMGDNKDPIYSAYYHTIRAAVYQRWVIAHKEGK